MRGCASYLNARACWELGERFRHVSIEVEKTVPTAAVEEWLDQIAEEIYSAEPDESGVYWGTRRIAYAIIDKVEELLLEDVDVPATPVNVRRYSHVPLVSLYSYRSLNDINEVAAWYGDDALTVYAKLGEVSEYAGSGPYYSELEASLKAGQYYTVVYARRFEDLSERQYERLKEELPRLDYAALVRLAL